MAAKAGALAAAAARVSVRSCSHRLIKSAGVRSPYGEFSLFAGEEVIKFPVQLHLIDNLPAFGFGNRLL